MTRHWIMGLVALALAVAPHTGMAWDYDGHRCVVEVAMSSLPDDVPAFLRTVAARDRVAYLSGEPDRWRVLRDPGLRHINEPDHYMDLEDLTSYGLTAGTLPPLRNDLIGLIYRERALHPDRFAPADRDDPASVYILPGLLPYAIHENHLKLKAGFVTLRNALHFGASEADIAFARQSILEAMGIMSHFVGDGAQPLHLSVHHHGWVGDNPHNYTTSRKFHSWIDGGFIAAAGITFTNIAPDIRPAKGVWPEKSFALDADAFPIIVRYLAETHRRVETLYRLEKAGKLDEFEPSTEGREFIQNQLLRGGQFLGDLYYSAFRCAETAPLPPLPVAPPTSPN